LKIFVLNLLTLIINLSLLLVISYKMNKFAALKLDFLAVQKNIEELLNETTYLSNTYLDNIETQITEGKMLLARLAEKETSLKMAENIQPPPEFKEESLDPVTREIVKLFKQGKTIVEIAEKLHTTQGEVAMRLNLGKKIKEKN
jgi:DNA-binding NarL/FixJ family response regulator